MVCPQGPKTHPNLSSLIIKHLQKFVSLDFSRFSGVYSPNSLRVWGGQIFAIFEAYPLKQRDGSFRRIGRRWLGLRFSDCYRNMPCPCNYGTNQLEPALASIIGRHTKYLFPTKVLPKHLTDGFRWYIIVIAGYFSCWFLNILLKPHIRKDTP